MRSYDRIKMNYLSRGILQHTCLSPNSLIHTDKCSFYVFSMHIRCRNCQIISDGTFRKCNLQYSRFWHPGYFSKLFAELTEVSIFLFSAPMVIYQNALLLSNIIRHLFIKSILYTISKPFNKSRAFLCHSSRPATDTGSL